MLDRQAVRKYAQQSAQHDDFSETSIRIYVDADGVPHRLDSGDFSLIDAPDVRRPVAGVIMAVAVLLLFVFAGWLVGHGIVVLLWG